MKFKELSIKELEKEFEKLLKNKTDDELEQEIEKLLEKE